MNEIFLNLLKTVNPLTQKAKNFAAIGGNDFKNEVLHLYDYFLGTIIPVKKKKTGIMSLKQVFQLNLTGINVTKER